MNTKRALVLIVAIGCLIGILFPVQLAVASHVTPTFVPGNPSCTDLGYDFGFKPQPEPPPSGIYNFPEGINTVTITSDGTYFDWLSTLGIDAVVVKGGPNANVYVHDPEEFSDNSLHSPINPINGQPYAISHIEFCYDYEVDVEKTAETTFTRTFEWTIDKSVTPETWDLFTGDSGTSKYTVAVTKTGYTDSDWAVSGVITIGNNTPFDATIENVTDTITGFGVVAVDCGVTFPHVLSSGGALACTYNTPLPDGSTRTNTATVATSGIVGGNSDDADVVFGAPTTLVNDTINVVDTNGGSWSFSDSGSVIYMQTFTCDADAGVHYNIATIGETGQTDDATVIVNCYALEVKKDASTSFTRTYDWSIDKSADQSSITLSVGQQFLVNYSIVVDLDSVTPYTDSEWGVSGVIGVFNDAPMDATLNSISDIVSPDIAATVDCGGLSFPYTLLADDKLYCLYSTSLPDAASRTNTATATLQNFSYAYDGTPTASGTTDFSGNADVVFSDTPTEEIDECIDISDTNIGFLGTVCYGDGLPLTLSYSLWIGPYDECGDYTVENTASFITHDTGTTGSDGWTVAVNVPCVGGCTLTPGYWKTHSEYGPAPYDDTWAMLPNGADTPFFLSGQSYYDVLWTEPRGNAYYNLAHAYIAAALNQLNGASIPSDVLDTYDEATSLLNTYTPAEIGSLKGNKPPRPQFIALAETLDDYNNGLTGPGHCSE